MKNKFLTITISMLALVCGAGIGTLWANKGSDKQVRHSQLKGFLSHVVPDSERTKILRHDDAIAIVTVDSLAEGHVTIYVAWDDGDNVVTIERQAPFDEKNSVQIRKGDWHVCQIGDLKRDGTTSFPAYIAYTPSSGQWKGGVVADYDLDGTLEVKRK